MIYIELSHFTDNTSCGLKLITHMYTNMILFDHVVHCLLIRKFKCTVPLYNHIYIYILIRICTGN